MLEKVENRGSFVFRGCERHDTGWPKSFAKRGTRQLVYLQQFGRDMRPKPELEEDRYFDYQAWILEGKSARLPKDEIQPRPISIGCECGVCVPFSRSPNGDILIPDIDDPDHPAWNGGVWNGKEFVFEPVAIPDCNNPMAEPVYDPATNNPAVFTAEQIIAGAGEAWFVPEELPYPDGAYKAENHSLGDGTLEGVESEVWIIPDFDDPGKELVLDRKSRTLTRREAFHSLNDGSRDRKSRKAWRDFKISVKRFVDGVACETASFFEEHHVVIAWFASCAALATFAVVAAGAAP